MKIQATHLSPLSLTAAFLATISMSLTMNETAMANSIHPGIWKASSQVHLNSISLPSTETEECVSKKDAKDLKTTLSKDLKEKGCELTEWLIKKNKLTAGLKCKNDDIDAEGQLQGRVDAKSYELTGDARGHYNGMRASVEVKFTGQYVGPCLTAKNK